MPGCEQNNDFMQQLKKLAGRTKRESQRDQKMRNHRHNIFACGMHASHDAGVGENSFLPVPLRGVFPRSNAPRALAPNTAPSPQVFPLVSLVHHIVVS